MNRPINYSFKSFLVLILFSFLFQTTLVASIAKVTYLEGSVLVTNKTQKGFKKASLGLEIGSNDVLNTHKNSKVKLDFNDGTIIVVGKSSTFSIENYLYDSKKENLANAKFKLSKGLFKVITGAIGKVNPNKFKLETSTASIGIRGTTIYADQKRVAFTEGQGFVRDIRKRKTIEIKSGQMTYTLKGKVPTKPIPISKLFQQTMNDLDKGIIIKVIGKNIDTNINTNKNTSSTTNTLIQNSNLNTNVTTENINVGANSKADIGVIETK